MPTQNAKNEPEATKKDQNLGSIGIAEIFYAVCTGVPLVRRGYPSISVNIALAVLLFQSYILLFFVTRWIIISTDFVSSNILPGFTLCAHLARRYGASIVGVETEADLDTVSAPTLLLTISLVYYVCVYMVSSVLSVVAQFSTSISPFDNVEPRLHRRNISSGLPHRTISTHDALYEFFPAFVLTAAFTAWQTSPSGSITSPAISAIAFHVFVKLAVWAPAYLLRAHLVRSIAHIIANDALMVALFALIGAE